MIFLMQNISIVTAATTLILIVGIMIMSILNGADLFQCFA
jgi:hypothetical protein